MTKRKRKNFQENYEKRTKKEWNVSEKPARGAKRRNWNVRFITLIDFLHFLNKKIKDIHSIVLDWAAVMCPNLFFFWYPHKFIYLFLLPTGIYKEKA